MGSMQGDDLQLNGDLACENAEIRGALRVGGVAVPAVIVHDASLAGDGTAGSPLATVDGETAIALAVGSGLAGLGTNAVPLANNVQHDASLAGLGTAGSPLAVVNPIPFASWRKVGAGTSVAIAASTTVTLGTFSRTAAEQMFCTGWVVNDVGGAAWAPDRSTLLGSADAVSMFFERTGVANEFLLRARNGNLAGPSRTVEWMVIGVTP